MLLVETLPTTVLSEEVKTLPTTYSPTHVHLTLPSTRRSMQGVFNVVNEGADKIGEAAKDVGEISNQRQDVVENFPCHLVLHSFQLYNNSYTSLCALCMKII